MEFYNLSVEVLLPNYKGTNVFDINLILRLITTILNCSD